MFDYLRLNNGIWSSAGLKHYHTKKNTSASDLVEQVQAAQPVKISLWFQTRVSSLNQWVGLTENLQDFPVFLIPLLVGGVPTILKKLFRQWEGWHLIYEMEKTNHVPVTTNS